MFIMCISCEIGFNPLSGHQAIIKLHDTCIIRYTLRRSHAYHRKYNDLFSKHLACDIYQDNN